MIEIVKVTAVRSLGDYRLEIWFSDGTSGIRDFSDIIGESGPMLLPLRDPTYFSRVFISMGVLSWPNGYDMDAIQLHAEMKATGNLAHQAAE
jgi:Protein of unknown function (DUF2442)